MKLLSLALSLIFSTAVAAQDYTPLMRNYTPYIVNSNETIQATGAPIIYIEGVKAPEKPKNEIERLALKRFGTTNISEITRNTLELDTKPSIVAPITQEKNFVISKTPNHNIDAGFVNHIADFSSLIQVLDQNTVVVNEDIIIINTDADKSFTRHIDLPHVTSFQLIFAKQNNQDYTDIYNTKEHLEFVDSVSVPLSTLKIGPNHVSIKYVLHIPLQQNQAAELNIHLTGTQLDWPIDRMNSVVLFPHKAEITSNKLLFGRNRIEVPDAYTTVIDNQGNIAYTFTHVIPANADIITNIIFNPNVFITTNDFIDIVFQSPYLPCILLWGILILYWVSNIYVEKRHLNLKHLPCKLHLPTPAELLIILSSSITLDDMYNILKNNNIIKYYKPVSKQYLLNQNTVLHRLFSIYIYVKTFWKIMWEMIIGTAMLIGITVTISSIFDFPFSAMLILYTLIFSGLSLTLLYHIYFKPYKRQWLKNLARLLMEQTVTTCLSVQHTILFYPLFIATHKHEEWALQLSINNPKLHQFLQKGGNI